MFMNSILILMQLSLFLLPFLVQCVGRLDALSDPYWHWCGNYQLKFQLSLQLSVLSDDDQNAQLPPPFHISLIPCLRMHKQAPAYLLQCCCIHFWPGTEAVIYKEKNKLLFPIWKLATLYWWKSKENLFQLSWHNQEANLKDILDYLHINEELLSNPKQVITHLKQTNKQTKFMRLFYRDRKS